jgi:hypothetical protein
MASLGLQEKPAQDDDPYIPPFALPDAQPAAGATEQWNADRMGFDFTQPSASQPPAEQPFTDSILEAPADQLEPAAGPLPEAIFLIIITVVELLILAVFGYLILTNFL